jgi:hypothetical protein
VALRQFRARVGKIALIRHRRYANRNNRALRLWELNP